MILCLILLKDYKAAADMLSYLINSAPKKYLKNLVVLRGIMYSALGNVSKSKKDLD